MRKKRNERERGFTLIELIAVVVILAVLATLLAPRIFQGTKRAQRNLAQIQIKKIEGALGLFQLDNGRFPTTEEGLKALIENPGVQNWNGPYGSITRADLKDPWGRDYMYRYPCQHPGAPHDYDLFTWGPTGVEGGTGPNAAITSWE